ncbi:hypothetical protein OAE26_02145 [Synechococcus sp. AH-551-E05]|nr:hypothetical protein [Synechococcus sp. AH-551-E05]
MTFEQLFKLDAPIPLPFVLLRSRSGVASSKGGRSNLRILPDTIGEAADD